jgi:hypothetical protein
MGYYSVIILARVQATGRRYDYDKFTPESVYFGEDEHMMQVKFFEAVRRAQRMPAAETVVVWHDLEEIVRVKIEH